MLLAAHVARVCEWRVHEQVLLAARIALASKCRGRTPEWVLDRLYTSRSCTITARRPYTLRVEREGLATDCVGTRLMVPTVLDGGSDVTAMLEELARRLACEYPGAVVVRPV